MAELQVFQSLWGMVSLGSPSEWTLSEKIERVRSAGFDGLEIPWTPTLPEGEEALKRVLDADLGWSLVVFPTSVDDLKEVADRFAGSSVSHINVQPNVRPMTVLEGVPHVLGWLEVARDAGLDVYFETHRDRMTTSLRYTVQLIDAIPEMRLVADLSHYLVGEEFAFPVDESNHQLIRRILARSRSFHGRVASREQVQIPISFAHHQPWISLFSKWWKEGFKLWKEQAGPDEELVFVTELGPPPYAITDADGRELSDRWQESLLLKDLARTIWRALG